MVFAYSASLIKFQETLEIDGAEGTQLLQSTGDGSRTLFRKLWTTGRGGTGVVEEEGARMWLRLEVGGVIISRRVMDVMVTRKVRPCFGL